MTRQPGPARIEQVTATHVRLPRSAWWPQRLFDRGDPIDVIDLVLCEVTTTDGASGTGYTYSLQRGGSVMHAMLTDEIAPLLIGRSIASPQAIWDEMWKAFYRFGRGGVVSVAMCAADIAVWDLMATMAGLPLYRYLGAYRDSIPVYGSSIDLGYELAELQRTVADWMDLGLPAVKIKVGRPVDEDLARLSAVREVIGAHTRLMVDANNSWDLAEATRRLHLMEPFDLDWLEEPLDPDDIDGHARLQARGTIAIAAGETLFSPDEFRRYIAADAVRYIQADVARIGGITPWLRTAALAHIHHLPMAPHFVHDIHAHLLCAIPNADILEYLPLLDAIMVKPLVPVAGAVTPPDLPGTGVRFRTDLIDTHIVSRQVIR